MRFIPVMVVVMLILSGCALNEKNYQKRFSDSKHWVEATFAEMVNAIKSENRGAFADKFSISARSEGDAFEEKVDELYAFIQGDVESYNILPGRSHIKNKDGGNIVREVSASFCLVTTENTYYIAIKECIIDSWNADNEGIQSLYIVNAKDWQTEYIYHGDGMWTHGINIQTEK